jgi:tRNA(Ile)-lysidine synthase
MLFETMIDTLKQFIETQKLFTSNDKLLLAVSGGIDSMVMLHLINQLDIKIGVAHCNFQLRGNESEEDAVFVKTTAEMLGLPFFMARFETSVYAEENKISIQMAARELRYTWFENTRKTHGYNYIATAHNSDDSIETFFINLSRGCGLDGLTGIKPNVGHIIRPILFASREQIVQYAKRKGINHREDSSNATDKYLRNYIRHNVLPVMDEAHSNFRRGIHNTVQNLIGSQTIYHFLLEKEKKDIVSELNGSVQINILKIQQFPSPVTLLWELLNPYGFNKDTCSEIAGLLDAQPGKVFLSQTHRLIKDRESLIVYKLQKTENQVYYIYPDSIPEGLPFELSLNIEDIDPSLPFERNKKMAMLDFELLEWPLILRKWHSGDYFAPLGMENLKKVSDFLIDQKLSLYDKENTWVVQSGNRIAWIAGQRIDHRFRIKENTKKILKLRVE